jgi:hypothetical protein
MSTESKPKTSVSTASEAATTSSDAAADQLKKQFSNLFGFFTKMSTDVTSSSTNLTNSLFQKGPGGFLEALAKKVEEKFKPLNDNKITKTTEKEKSSKETGDKSHRENGNHEIKSVEKEKSSKEKGDKSHRENPPKQVLKEVNIQQENKKPQSTKANPTNAPVAKYNSFQDLFGSISTFISHTATSIQTSSSNVYKTLQTGIDLNARVKSGFKPSLIKAEARKSAMDSATKKRLEEARKMKENFEKQLRSLDQEIGALEKGENLHTDEGSNRSRQNVDGQTKKAFRINSQKSSRENGEKVTGAANQPKPAKKVLGPLEDVKPAGKKWQEGEKVIKTVSSQPLYLRMEKEFLQNVVFPELETRKEKLKIKREFYKPIEDKELREHALKYEERKKNLMHNEIPEKLAPLNFVKSNAYKKVLEQDKEEKTKSDQKAGELKQRKEKQQQYAKIVKEMYFPKSDPKDDLLSKENLQEIIARSQKAELLPIMTSTTKESNTGPKLQLKKKRPSQDISPNVITEESPERSYIPHAFLKRKPGQKVHISPPVVESVAREAKVDTILPREGLDEEQIEVKPPKKLYEKKPRVVSMSPKRIEKKAFEQGEDEVKADILEPELAKKSYPNYLADVRKNRIEQEKKTGKGKYGQWEKHLKNKGMTQQEKVMNILDDINRMEFQAKKKESKLRRHDPAKEFQPLELEDDVGEMYLESIKAKLAIIKDLA